MDKVEQPQIPQEYRDASSALAELYADGMLTRELAAPLLETARASIDGHPQEEELNEGLAIFEFASV